MARDLGIAKHLWVMFGLLVVANLVTFGAAYFRGTQVLRINHEIARRQASIANIGELLSTIKDAESGQRGFLLTDEESDLQL